MFYWVYLVVMLREEKEQKYLRAIKTSLKYYCKGEIS